MTAHFSSKNQERRKQQRQAHEAQMREANAKLAARISVAKNILVKHGWSVRDGDEPSTWHLKMPGSAEMLCRGLISLERKTIGMGNPNMERYLEGVG